MNGPREIASDPLDTREIIFTSLLLLGFDPREMEDTNKIPFSRNMFSVPNKKGFEVVMHFLFEKLNPALAHERFRNCWPVYDKKQEQGFRKTISNWLTEISKEDPDAKLPRIAPSLFMSPGGDKFYTLLFYFSHYVVLKTCKHSHGVKSRDILLPMTITASTKQFVSVMVRTVQSPTFTLRKRFLQGTQELIDLQGEWKKYASTLVKECRSLCKKIRDLEHRIRGEEGRMIAHTEATGGTPNIRLRSSGMTDGEWDVLAVKRAQKVQKVRGLWRSVEDCNQAQATERAVVASILSEGGRRDRLDAADISVQVPELLLRECEQEIQQRRINNVYEGGKLDLVALIKLWNLALRLYLEELNEAPIPDFDRSVPSVAAQVHTQNAQLVNARAIRHSLSDELLPDLERSVSELMRYRKEGIQIPTRDTLVEASPGRFLGPGVGLLPSTPPVSFDPAATPKVNAAGMRTMPSRFRKSPVEVSTPEAMTKVRETVHKTALKKASLAQGTPASTLKDVRVPTPQGTKGAQKPSRMKAPTRHRIRSAASTRVPPANKATPVSARRPTVESHLSTSRRIVQTTTKKAKKPPAFQRPTESARKKRNTKDGDRFGYNPVTSDDATTGKTTEPTAAERAHNMLADQIVDFVVSDSPEVATATLTFNIPSSEDTSPAVLALKDPLGGLGLDAFVSREKVQHSPLIDVEGSTDTPVEQASSHTESSGSSYEDGSTLVATSEHSQREPCTATDGAKVAHRLPMEGAWSEDKSQTRDPNPEYAEWNTTLQKMSLKNQPSSPAVVSLLVSSDDGHDPTVSLGATMSDNVNSASLAHQREEIIQQDLLQFVESDESRGSTGRDSGEERPDSHSNPFGYPQGLQDDNLISLDLSNGEENMGRSYPYSTFESPARCPNTDQFGNDVNQQDISLWHLDEELPEVFQTRTPQLPERLRTKSTGAGKPGSPHSLPSGVSLETPEREATPSRNIKSTVASPQSQGGYPEARKLNMTSSVEEEDSESLGGGNQTDKRRFRSGSSQKSVTFSEPLAEEGREENGLELSQRTQSIAEETMPDIDEEDQFPPSVSDRISPRAGSPFDECSHGRGVNGLISEEYLVRSPRPAQSDDEHTDLFSIDLESPEMDGVSFSMTRPIEDLLEQVSPTVTPSKTPQLRKTGAHRTQGSGRVTPDLTPELPTKGRHGRIDIDATPTGPPPGQDTSLSQKMASLRLASGLLRVNGTTQHRLNKALKTPADFSILEEDDSILVPVSPD